MFMGGGVVFTGGVSGLLVAPWGGGDGLRGALSAGGKGSVSASRGPVALSVVQHDPRDPRLAGSSVAQRNPQDPRLAG